MTWLAKPAWSSLRGCQPSSMASWGTLVLAATTTSTGLARKPEPASPISVETSSERAELQGLAERRAQVGLEGELGGRRGPGGQAEVVHQGLHLAGRGQQRGLDGISLEHRSPPVWTRAGA